MKNVAMWTRVEPYRVVGTLIHDKYSTDGISSREGQIFRGCPARRAVNHKTANSERRKAEIAERNL